MARRNRRSVTILGYRFKRDFILKALVLVSFLVLLIVVSIILLLLVSERRQEAVRAKAQNTPESTQESVEKERLEQPGAPREAVTSSEAGDWMTRQRNMSGFPLPGVLLVRGQISSPAGVQAFQLWWSPYRVRLEIGEGEGKAVYWIDDKGTRTNVQSSIPEQPDWLMVLPFVYDPFRYSGLPGYDYSMLFDETYEGRPCRVIGLRKRGSRESRIFLDAKTMRELRRLIWLVGHEQGQYELRFGSYTESSEGFFPKWIQIEGGNRVISLDISDYQLVEVSPGLFDAQN